MKKHISLLIVCAMLLALCACGTEDAAPTTVPPSTQAPETLPPATEATDAPAATEILPPTCAEESVAATDTVTSATPAVSADIGTMLAEDLLGLSASEIIGMFGINYVEITPEGDPPYFFYEYGTPFCFVGTPTAESISHIQASTYGCPVIPGVYIGDTLEHLENVVAQSDTYTYTPAENWYDDLGYTYGWVQVASESVSYSVYIIGGIVSSFDCIQKGG